MRASLLIAAHNEGGALWKTIRACVETTPGFSYEIVVADDASNDGSVEEALSRFPQIRVVRNQERLGASPSKHAAALEANGDILVFLDGHTNPNFGTIKRLVEDVELLQGQAIIAPAIPHLDTVNWLNSRSQIGHGYSVQLDTLACRWTSLKELTVREVGRKRFHESPALIGCALAISKELYQLLNGFDVDMRFWGVEDIDFGMKSVLMGYPILVDPQAVVGHRFRKSFDNYTVPNEHVIANQLRFARKHFTSAVWSQWVQACRARSDGSLPDHPEGLWTRAWQIFEERRPSAEQERHFLHSRRIHDEFWYAEKFKQAWPRLATESSSGTSVATNLSPATAEASAATSPSGTEHALQPIVFSGPSPSPSPSPPPSDDKPIPDPTAPCDPTCIPSENTCCTCCDNTSSPQPVRYVNGELQHSAVDLSSDGFGSNWQHQRTFSNQLSFNGDVGQGFCWLMQNSPYLWPDDTGALVAVIGTEGSLWFDQIGSNYVARYGAKATLVQNTAEATLTLTQPTGYVYVFQDFTHAFPIGGVIWKRVEPGGQVTTAMGYNSAGAVTEFQRSNTVGGNTVIESFLYGFDVNDRITSVLLRRQINGGAWTGTSQAIYTYHDGTDSFGSAGDLKLVQTQLPSGSGWVTIDTTYYRYYVTYGGTGYIHGMKYILNPASYQMMVGLGIDPTTASDATLSLYADFYYEYYPYSQQVAHEVVYRGSQSYTYEYEESGQPLVLPPSNTWVMKTIEHRPDGSRTLVYTNGSGQPLVKDFYIGSDHWIEAWKYDGYGNEIQYASPAAVISYSEVISPFPGTLQVNLQPHQGLIRYKEYYSSTGSGGAFGYLWYERISEGDIPGPGPYVNMYTYAPVTGYPYPYGGQPTFLIASHIQFPTGVLTDTITTSYSYTFYVGNAQVQTMTKTLPVISTAQNGSGVAATSQTYYDQWGRATWLMDERGFITNKTYDLGTGALIQQIEDVDTTVTGGAPSGWTTPSGGGLNLVTDNQIDNLGRTIQILGPSHTIDLMGTATIIRRAKWFVYQDASYETWTARGYAKGSSPSYTYTLINPVSIKITDAEGRLLQEIAATRGSGTTSPGALSPTDSYPQSSYVRWRNIQYLDCCFVASEQVYKLIPASGPGVPGTNYDETDYGYDIMKRRYRTVTPGGTITDLVYDVRNNVVAIYVGTNDTGATPTDPTGGGVPGNNMVIVSSNVIDGGSDGGDGNITQSTDYVDTTTANNRVSNYTYDFRNRLTVTQGPLDFCMVSTYDNLDRIVMSQQYNTTTSGQLVAQSSSTFDDQSRLYQSTEYAVDPTTGFIGTYTLIDNFWYDASGNQVKSFRAGTQLFAKSTYDSLGRPTVRYSAFGNDSSYSDAFSVANNTVLRQDETAYDAAGNVIQITIRERYHNAAASQVGALTNPSGTPAARVTYFGIYPDPIGRTINAANFGTNGGTPLVLPSTCPARSDTILIDSTAYDASGNVLQTTNPAAMVVAYLYDARRREIQITNNSGGSSIPSLCTSSDDTNQIVQYTYTPDNKLGTQIALNSRTGNQTTTYTYGTTLSNSTIATSNLLSYVDYPDSTGGPGGSDSVALTWNRQRQRLTLADQRGCVHSYFYDLLGRLTNDCVPTLGTGVDNTVLQLAAQYEVRGMISQLTSFASATPNSGSIVNDVQLVCNAFGQIISDTQSHSGAVVPGTTPMVRYGYYNGATNTIRPQTLTYPNGRVVTIGYGTSGGINDSCSRVDNLVDSSATLVNYSYLGLGTAVQVTYSQPGIQYTLLGSSSGTSPAGDIYWGLDLFGRIIDSRWYNTSTNADVDRIQYGYDQASNRIWRKNPVATALSAQFDEFYVNDGLYRLKQMQRGTLNSTNTGITSPTFGQCWTLDPIGNWMGFSEASSGGSWTTVQTRIANLVNQISSITNTVGGSWGVPAYDAAGNMTTMPQSAAPGSSFTTTYDAWNRLVTIVDTSSGSTVQSNQYDARTFRTIINTYTGGTLVETRHCYYTTNWKGIEERVDADTTSDKQFVWGLRYTDDLILRDYGSQRFFALQDSNWNITSIVDTTGTVQERYAYTPYGTPTFLTSAFRSLSLSSFGWETLYSAYRFDAATGIYYVHMRYLHSLLGSWLTRDPLDYPTLNYSLYCYSGSSPLQRTDPYGLADKVTQVTDDAGNKCNKAGLIELRSKVWNKDDGTPDYAERYFDSCLQAYKDDGEKLGKADAIDQYIIVKWCATHGKLERPPHTGHAWLFIDPSDGKNDEYGFGFYPVPSRISEMWSNPLSGDLYGEVKKEKDLDYYTHFIPLKACPQTIGCVRDEIEKIKKKPGVYCLRDTSLSDKKNWRHCTTFAIEVLTTCGFKLPYKEGKYCEPATITEWPETQRKPAE